jgi:hypothetical protein
VGKHLGKWPVGRHRTTWQNNIKMYLRDVGYEDGRWLKQVYHGISIAELSGPFTRELVIFSIT